MLADVRCVRETVAAPGRPLGRYRLTAKSDEDGGGPFALCDCEGGHASAAEAQECPAAKDRAARY